MDSSSRTRNAPSAALSSIAAFSRKHLVPPTPSPNGAGMPSSHSYLSGSPRGSILPSMDSIDPSPSRFQGLKRSLNLKPLPQRRPATHLNTPEEERGHGQARPNMPLPPTIQQIASGLATRATSTHASTSQPLPQRIRTTLSQTASHHDHPTNSRLYATRSTSASSSTSSVTIPNHPVPLRSSLKKTSTNSSVTSSLAPSASTAPTSLQSAGSRGAQPNSLSFPPKVTAVRNLFASLHGHARHNPRSGGTTGLSMNRSGTRSDDGGSILSDNSRVRRIGRVRFSDDEDESGRLQTSGNSTASIQQRIARTMSAPSPAGTEGSRPGIGAPPPVSGADTPTSMSLGLPPLSALPARLINTKKTVIKIFHRSTSSQ